MDHQWRPRPPQGAICPICTFSHFPFCPPPQNPPFNHFPPQPDYPRPVFDPYPSPMGTHHPYTADPRPMHINPNLSHQYPTNPMYDYGNYSNGFVSEVDRSYKRPRVDELPTNSGRFLSEDERRLKLIRDHGVVSSGPPLPPPPPPPPQKIQSNDSLEPSQTDYWQAFSGSNQLPQQHYGMQQPNYVSQNNNLGQNYRGVTQYGAPNPNMNERGGGGGGGYLPPLPASPPPPLPVDAPMNHSSEFSSSPPETSHSLFPVVHSSYQPILPHASTGFISEVYMHY